MSSIEGWTPGHFRSQFEGSPDFDKDSIEHPLQARLWIAFCHKIDSAFESFVENKLDEFSRYFSEAAEIASWLGSDQPMANSNVMAGLNRIDETSKQEAFKKLLALGIPLDNVMELSKHGKRKR